MQNNLNRWYDPKLGRWLSEDPISFAAGDANLYRYVGNSVVDTVDPSGLAPPGLMRLQLGNGEAIYDASGKLSRLAESSEAQYSPYSVRREQAYDARVREVFHESGELNTFPFEHGMGIEGTGWNSLQDTAGFVFIGDYYGVEPSGDQVGAGVVAGLCGIDVTKDYLDIIHGFHHWEWSWSHAGNQALNGLALLPVVGASKSAKYADDVGAVGKNLDCVPVSKRGGLAVDAVLDATGKVHGKLPDAKDLGRYDVDDLVRLRDELKQSVPKRIEVTVQKGSDFGHSDRLAIEQQLIKSIEKYLKDHQ